MLHANAASPIAVAEGNFTRRSRFTRTLVAALVLLAGLRTAHAGGPRWVSGAPYFNNWRVMVTWYTNHPRYFTDPGDLSPSVNHAAADAIVARAAAVWNVPTASLVLDQGGLLNEHLSSANVYASASGIVFPDDVRSSNYAAKQIAVLYDSNGSITDMLLGNGGSDPGGCLQNGVTESVDSITPGAQIQHAILVLNGRCTGPEPEKQLQIQYQLMRAFGRILGLSWSQTNDNVFTGSPAPTYSQAQNWPIMHPIDIVCGLYTYQCLPDPFTLRPDDISSLQELYFIQPGQAAAGKRPSWQNAGGSYGRVFFPDGQGMEGVNVVVRRRAPFWNTPEEWQVASSVTGYAFRGHSSTPVAASGSSVDASVGMVDDGSREGYWRIQSIPVPPSQEWTDLVISTEAVNPLYTGPYAIGPQTDSTISPSGSPGVQVSAFLANGRDNMVNFSPADAAAPCAAHGDGSEAAPSAVPQGGWWNGTLCGYGHSAWSSLAIKSGRTATLEVTAVDERGFVSLTKVMPTIGVWNAADPIGVLPTVASAAHAFNSTSVGMTSLRVTASSAAANWRVAFADQRGVGRPDFAYQARILYADAVSPANVGAGGGTVTISGMGFRQGNAVFVNGVAAAVSSWTPTTITAVVPSLHALGLSRATIASITVKDLSTSGTSAMSGVLTYAAPVEALELVSAPTGSIPASTLALTSFSVRAIAPDGFTPIIGEVVSVTTGGAGALLSPCGAPACTVMTNSDGIASVGVTPSAQGSVSLQATGRSGTATASFTATPSEDVLSLLTAPSGVATVGMPAATPLRLQISAPNLTTVRPGAVVQLTTLSGAASFGACNAVPCNITADATGTVTTSIVPLSEGTITIRLASANGTATLSFRAAKKTLQLVSAPADKQTVGINSPSSFSVRVLAGDGITPLSGESVILSASGAPVRFLACGGPVCTLATDAQGLVQSAVSPLGQGSVTLTALADAGAVTSAFASALPDLLLKLSAPSGATYVGDTLAAPFAVKVTAGDGLTPLPGKLVSFSASPVSAIFAACGAPTCSVVTDATGVASLQVTAVASGQVHLVAVAQAGTATSDLLIATRTRSISLARPVQFVAEGVTMSWVPQVVLTDNSASTSAIPVSWASSPRLTFASSSSQTGTDGTASIAALTGPVSAGEVVSGTACAWTAVCTPVQVRGVSANEWRLVVVSGDRQSVSNGESLGLVTLLVTDATGDPVGGVPVQVRQSITAWAASCPNGRCPISSVLQAGNASFVSDQNGRITIVPVQMAGVSGITQVAAIAGSGGFATISLETHP